ncbi:MAG: dihydroorotate dehydrogenase electron transfer subunit [Candidatus Cloacimonadota bacterium]|nr:MAG: dihydroorotate dehydrogenase electron transfer subunit [Candidatus Cloacimonadota bacterium]
MLKICPVTKIEKLNPEYYLLSFQDKEMAELSLPGQFYEIKIPGDAESMLRIPISVYDIREDEIVLMIKVVGKGTAGFMNLKPGDDLDVIGPLGNSFTVPENKNVLLVSGGIGYAPLFLLNKILLQKNNKVTRLHGGRGADDVFEAEYIFTDDGSIGEKGFVTIGLAKLLKENKYDIAYTCGPDIMMKNCFEITRKANLKLEVSLEEYMACGIGVCYGCAVGIKDNSKQGFSYKRVCKDGPVFDASEVVWNE